MDMTPHFPIYLDCGATTPVDPRVVDAMVPWLREHFGNAASRSRLGLGGRGGHREGARPGGRPDGALTRARSSGPNGATESINLGLEGCRPVHRPGKHLITLKTEHKAVLDTMRELERRAGWGDLPGCQGRRPAGSGCPQGRGSVLTPS